jgi:anti-sigma regulatory factor (Ser/Thr protein kinase)
MTAADRYTAALSADPAEIQAVRRAVAQLAARSGFAARADDLVLALDEILANAQEHGRPPISVEAWGNGRLVVEVQDSGPGFDYVDVCSTHPPEPFGRRGRGLWIVRQLVDLVRVESSPSGTHVRMELAVDRRKPVRSAISRV